MGYGAEIKNVNNEQQIDFENINLVSHIASCETVSVTTPSSWGEGCPYVDGSGWGFRGITYVEDVVSLTHTGIGDLVANKFDGTKWGHFGGCRTYTYSGDKYNILAFVGENNTTFSMTYAFIYNSVGLAGDGIVQMYWNDGIGGESGCFYDSNHVFPQLVGLYQVETPITGSAPWTTVRSVTVDDADNNFFALPGFPSGYYRRRYPYADRANNSYNVLMRKSNSTTVQIKAYAWCTELYSGTASTILEYKRTPAYLNLLEFKIPGLS